MSDLTAEEQQQVDEMLAGLHALGYVDVAEHEHLRPGVRIRHRGERYYEALEHGTGVVVAITELPDSAWSRTYRMPDVELITLSDTARFNSRLSQLAQYHVAVIEGGSE